MVPYLSNRHKKVLFLSLSGIGNFLMQAPTWHAIKKVRPDYHVTVWVAPRGTSQLAEADPHIDHVIEGPIKNSLLGHLRAIRRLRRQHFDVGFALSPGQLIKSAAYLYLAGIPRRIGHAYPLGSKPHSRFLLTDTFDEDDKLHDVEQNLRLLEQLGIKPKPGEGDYQLNIPSKNQQEAQEIIRYNVISRDRKLIGLHPGSAPSFLWKRWPLANFAAVGQALIIKNNAHILIFGGPDEQVLKEKLKAALGEHSTIINTHLLTTAALMQQCQFVLANDSGLMHLAAASETRVFGLFGPTNERHVGPRGVRSHVIRAPGTKPAYNTEKNFNFGPLPHRTILAITPEQVLDKILRVV